MPENYINILNNIETAKEEKKYLNEHPEETNMTAQQIENDIAGWEEELKNMRADWKTEEEPDMCEEIQLLKNWIKEKENLKKER